MNTLKNKCRFWEIVVACAVVFGLLGVSGVEAHDPKNDFCHFEHNEWNLISLPESGIEGHLEMGHDDGFPGGETRQSGTRLDEECVELVVQCPCDFSVYGLQQVGIDGTGDETCFVSQDSTVVSVTDNGAGGLAQALPSGILRICYRTLPGITFDSHIDLSEVELDVCRNDLLTNAPPCAGN